MYLLPRVDDLAREIGGAAAHADNVGAADVALAQERHVHVELLLRQAELLAQ